MKQNKTELLNIVVDSFEDLKTLEQSVKKAFSDLDKDISDLCFKFITIVGLSTFLLSGKFDQHNISGNNKILAILYFVILFFYCLSVICYWLRLLKSSSIHHRYLNKFVLLSNDYSDLYGFILNTNNINSDTIKQIETFLINCDVICKKQPLDHPIILLLRKGQHAFYTITIIFVVSLIISVFCCIFWSK